MENKTKPKNKINKNEKPIDRTNKQTKNLIKIIKIKRPRKPSCHLVNVRATASDSVHVRVELRAAIADFAEEALTATAGVSRVVDANVVVFSADGFFHERFVEAHAADLSRGEKVRKEVLLGDINK